MDVVFDVHLDGAGLDAFTEASDQSGRMVGGLVGAVMIELIELPGEAQSTVQMWRPTN